MKIKKIVKIISIVFASCFFFHGRVSAAAINLYASRTSVTVGQTVVITAKTTDAMGSYSISSSNSSILSGGTSGGFSTPNEQVTTTFVAKQAGTATITFRPVNMALFSTEGSYTSSSSVTITVGNVKPKVVSEDNTLSSLSIDQISLSPSFSKNVTDYTALAQAGTTKINLKATPSDTKATVTGTGEKMVKEGDNQFEIVVKAESGATKTYTIRVTVQEYDPIETKINGKKYSVVRNKENIPSVSGYEDTTVKIDGEEVPALKSKITGFTLVALKDEKGKQNFYIYKNNQYTLYKEYTFNKIILYPMEIKKIPLGYQKTTIIFNEDKIDAYKYRKNSNFALIYGMNVETGKKHLYMYDKEEDTLQIYNDEQLDKIDDYRKMIAGLCGISTLLFLLFIIVVIKNHKHNKQQKKKKKELKRKKKQQKKEWNDDEIDVSQIM